VAVRTKGSASPESALLRRTTWRLGLQIASSFAVIVAALSALAVFIVLRTQQADATALLQQATSHADDVTDPPAGVWLAIETATHTRTVTPGLPKGLPDQAALDRTTRTGTAEMDDVTVAGTGYRVYTQVRGTETVQAVLNLHPDRQAQERLVMAMVYTGGHGIVLSAVVGMWFGRRAVRPMATALALQRRFVSDASHELRTPLALLTTRAQLHRRHLRHGAAPDVLTDEADGVVTDASHLTDILEDLLLAADARPGSPTVVIDLADLAEQAVAAAVTAAAEQPVTVTLSRPDRTIRVRGTRGGLRRALTALLDNAVRHADTTVTVTVQRSESHAVVDVTDDGPGIDPAILPRMFERFASTAAVPGDIVPTARQQQRRRYGLGLALVSEIAARHGGTISAHPAPGGGAVLRLTLPALGDSEAG
jgi:signal transduction histidine kinase